MNIKVSLVLMAAACAACAANVDAGSSQLDTSNGGSTNNPNDPSSTSGPSDQGCWWGLVQSNTDNVNGCESDTALEQSVETLCAEKQGAVATFQGDEACGKGSSQQAKYECCPVPPPPPCFTSKVGDGKQCYSDADLDKLAVSACAAQSAKLVKFDPDEACPSVPPEGASYFAAIACCY